MFSRFNIHPHLIRKRRRIGLFLTALLLLQVLTPALLASPVQSAEEMQPLPGRIALFHASAVPALVSPGRLSTPEENANQLNNITTQKDALSSFAYINDNAEILVAEGNQQDITLPPKTPQPEVGMATKPAVAAREIIVCYENDESFGMRPQSLEEENGTPKENTRLSVVALSAEDDPVSVIEQLEEDPAVKYAEPNYILQAQVAPNDQSYVDQWALSEINAISAWDTAVEAEGALAPVTVAVIDSGVDGNHEDLAGKILPGYNTVGGVNSADSSDDSGNGHGTHIAGVIAAQTNNVTGVAGASGNLPVDVLPVKVLDKAGYGTMYDISMGIRYAVDWAEMNNRKIVINLSLGARLPDYPMTLAAAVQYAQDKGALVVAAAGNDKAGLESFYPACLPGVLAVAASGKDHHMAGFSNYGDIPAPGVDILSTLPGNRYGRLSGTSQAAAFVSATAAMQWSAYPDKSAAQAQEALISGRSDYPEGCKVYYWGTVCSYHYYVLNANQAVYNLGEEQNIYDTIEFANTAYDAHLSGEIPYIAKVSNPAKVAEVQFWLNPYGESIHLGTVTGPLASGIYTYQWDSTALLNGKPLPDGEYTVEARSMDSSGVQLAACSYDFKLANESSSGLHLAVKKPDASLAAGALVGVYHRYFNEDYGQIVYECVWEDEADLQGQINIPNAMAKDGNDYLVTALGTEPNFFYYETLRAPGTYILDGTASQAVGLKGLKTDGTPLGNAIIMADLLEASFADANPSPGVAYELQEKKVAVLNAAGEATLNLSPGRYNFRLLDEESTYYLVQHDVLIDTTTTTIDFTPQSGDVATVKLASDSDYYSSTLLLKDSGDDYYGFKEINSDTCLTVTPGSYNAVIKAIKRDAENNIEWNWGLESPNMDLAAGDKKVLQFGTPLSGSLSQWQDEMPVAGESYWMNPAFNDAFGNTTTGIAYQSYTPASLPASAQSSGSVIARMVADKPAEKTDPSGSTPQEEQIYVYERSRGDFVLSTQAVSYIRPAIRIYDPQGAQVMPQTSYEQTCSYSFAEWYIPAQQSPGQYSAQVYLDAGTLTNGTCESPPFLFTVQAEASSNIEPSVNVTLLDRMGEPMTGASVDLMQLHDGQYRILDSSTADEAGQASFYSEIAKTGSYALKISGMSADPLVIDSLSEPLALLVPLTAGTVPLNIMVDASRQVLHRISLAAQDQTLQPITSDSLYYYGYRLDEQGNESLVFKTPYEGENVAVWLAPGEYRFEASVNNQYSIAQSLGTSAPATQDLKAQGYLDPLYLLTREVQVSASGEIVLGGSGLGKLDLLLTELGDSYDYYLGGAAFYRQGQTETTLFKPFKDQSIYLTPGAYQAEAVLIRNHYDGQWDYWLGQQLDIQAGSESIWEMNDNFTTQINLADDTYALNQQLTSSHLIKDDKDNRLLAMGLNFEFYNTYLPSSMSERSTAALTVQNQPLEKMAPFFIIKDPQGQEVYRYRDADPNFNALSYWCWNEDGRITALKEQGTFYTGKYQIPENATGGTYMAALELGVGPQGIITAQTPFSVAAVPSAPTLEAFEAPTRAEKISLSGNALPAATVYLQYRFNQGEVVALGNVNADAEGKFTFADISLADEGSYEFSAYASLGGLTGEVCSPQVLVVDRTAPGSPLEPVAVGQDFSHILISWTAPSDTDIDHYLVYREDTLLGTVAANALRQFLDTGLSSEIDYLYEIIAVDQAGNQSEATAVNGRTASSGDQMKPSAPGELRLNDAPTSANVTLTWTAATDNIAVVAYKVWRSMDGAEPVLLATTEQLSFSDDNLLAETTFVYTVSALDEAGNESSPSNPLMVTTPALQFTSISYSVPRNMNGLIKEEASITVNLAAQYKRKATAELIYTNWYDETGTLLNEPQERTLIMELPIFQEYTSLGTASYRGSFQFPAGTEQLLSVKATLRDEASHSVTATADALPLFFTGRLELIMAEEALTSGLLDDATAEIWSETKKSGTKTSLSAEGVFTLRNLTPADDYSLRITNQKGQLLKEQSGLHVIAGQNAQIPMTTRLPASLDVQVIDAQSGEPVPGIAVYFNHADESPQGMGLTDEAGWVKNNQGQRPAIPIALSETILQGRVQFTPAQQAVYSHAERLRTTLEPGLNQAMIQLYKRPVGILQGKVTDDAGKDLAEATITAVQYVEERAVSKTVLTDANGNYSLELLSGINSEISFRHRRTSPVEDQEVFINDNTVLNMVLPAQAAVTLNVFTKTAENAEPVPLMLDWRVAVHFRINIQNLRTRSVASCYSTWPNVILPDGQAGDQIKITVDGYEGGYSKQEQIVTLDAYRYAEADITLTQQGKLRASIYDTDGSKQYGERLNVMLYRYDENVWKGAGSLYEYGGGEKTFGPIPEGNYRGVLYWGPRLPVVQNGRDEFAIEGSKIIEDIVIRNGETTELGNIVLPFILPWHSQSGYFKGQEGNSFSASMREAAPNSVVTLRASYRYSGSQSNQPQDMKLSLSIPRGATLVPDSIQVRAEQGAASVPVIEDTQISMNLIPEAETNSSVSGVVSYQVRLSAYPDWPTAGARAWMEFSAGNRTYNEDLGNLEIATPYVSVEAPSPVISRNIKITGQALADQHVRVYDGEYFLGEATANRYGLWQMQVLLPDRGQPAMHFLNAQTGEGESLIGSLPVRVVFDPNHPTIIRFTMQQTDGRLVEIDPQLGVASFPYVFVPGMNFTFNITFNNHQAVEEVALIGSNERSDRTYPAVWNEAEQCYSVTAKFEYYSGTPGDLYVSYKIKDTPYQPVIIPSSEEEIRALDEELRRAMPQPWRDATVTVDDPGQVTEPGSGPNPSPQINIALNDNPQQLLKITFGYNEISDFAANPAIPMIGISNGSSVSNLQDVITELPNGGFRLRRSCVVPASVLNDYLAAGSQSFSAQASNSVELWVMAESPYEGGMQLADLYDTVKSGFDFKDKLDELSAFQDQAARSCNSGAAGYYNDMAEHLADTAMINLSIKYTLQVGGIALGLTGVGLIGTAAVGVISNLLTEVGEAKWEQNFNDLKQQLSNDDECKDDEQDDDNDDRDDSDDRDDRDDRDYPKKKKKIAKPKYIWDPSGYVYEAVVDNRIEGVTTTIFEKDTDSGQLVFWDATEYLQENPLVTDSHGRYAWDVPAGYWQVAYEKEGYQTAYSSLLEVPPPQLDVNVPIVSLAPPVVTGAAAAGGGSCLEISFDKYMRLNSMTDTTIAVLLPGQVDEFGNPERITGTISAINPSDDPGAAGAQLAKTIRFTPAQALTVGEAVNLQVSQMVQSYAGRTMAADYSTTLTVPAVTVPEEPAVPGNGSSSGGRSNPPVVDQLNSISQTVSVTSGVQLSSKDDAAVVTIPAGAVSADGILKVSLASKLPFLGSLTAGSQGYDIVLENTTLGGRATISISYDPERFRNIAPEQIGIYYWDESLSKWVYLGGIVDKDNHRVTVTVNHLSLYAVLADTSIPVFKDIHTHWAYAEIVRLAGSKITGGYPDGTFRPDANISRAEFAKLLVEAMGWQAGEGIADFADAADLPVWASGYIATAAAKGVIKGYADSTFRADQLINRAEMATMVIRALSVGQNNQTETIGSNFTDHAAIPSWAQSAVELAVKAGILKGLPGNVFGPLQNATRAETAVILTRMLDNPKLATVVGQTQTINASGVVAISNISGPHYELRSCSSSQTAKYVLIPNSEVLAERLKTLLGQTVAVAGSLSEGADIYMRGPMLKVTEIKVISNPGGG